MRAGAQYDAGSGELSRLAGQLLATGKTVDALELARQLAEEGNKRALRVQKLLADPTRFLSAIQIGVTFVGFLASAVGAISLAAPVERVLPRPNGSRQRERHGLAGRTRAGV
jgi:phage-related minor tail protein